MPFHLRTHINPYRALMSTVILALPTVFAAAQGTPHLNVSADAYHTLVQPGILVTAAMCQQGDAFCLAHAVGNPLFNQNVGDPLSYASDGAGNVYIADDYNEIIVKVTPAGQPTIVAGEYGVQATTDAPPTSPASSTLLGRRNTIAADHAGNVYIGSSGGSTAVLKLDTAGTVHRLTAPMAQATPSPVEGALASTQFVDATSLAVDTAGDVYLVDGHTSTVRVISAKTEDMNTVVGCLASGCNTSGAPVSGEKAALHQVSGSVAVGRDGTIYLTETGPVGNIALYSVTDGVIHTLAPINSANEGNGIGAVAGPVATQGAAGIPYGPVAVDAAGNAYFASSTLDYVEVNAPTVNNLIEVTKGSPKSPAQVLILSTGPGPECCQTGDPFGDIIPTLNPEGMPSTLTMDLVGTFTLDPFGRIVMPTQNANPANQQDIVFGVGPALIGVGYFDRNGAATFNTNYRGAPGTDPTNPLVLTLVNSGSAALKTVNIANSGTPYYLLPTAAEIKVEGGSGAPPFSLDQTTGSCLALYAPTRTLTLQPGESCTLVFHYTPNATAIAAGSFTLYTNDPLGPLTVDLSATPIVSNFSFDQTVGLFGTYNGLTISSIVLTPKSPVSTNGSVTINAAVASSVYEPNGPLTYSFGLADQPVIPTGRIYAAASNNNTGAEFLSTVHTLDADGNTTFTFTNLPAGTYSLEARYLGDGTSAPSNSTVQTLTVTPH